MTDLLANAPVDVAKPEVDDLKFWSVTTIIGALDRPALVPWAANTVADEAIRIAHSLPQRIQDDGPVETRRWLANSRYRRPAGEKSATELGTAVHDAIETYAITGERPDVEPDIEPFLEQFDRWAQQFQPAYEAAEMTVFDTRYGYAGTLDAIFTFGPANDRRKVIVDYKTTAKRDTDKVSGPYPEVALQLAAYRFAELAAAWRPRRFEQMRRRYYLLGPDERELAVKVPEVEGAVVLHLSPDHCMAYPVRSDEEVHRAFLYTLEAARWVFETSKTAIGEPLAMEVA